jgi:hypothetical protein
VGKSKYTEFGDATVEIYEQIQRVRQRVMGVELTEDEFAFLMNECDRLKEFIGSRWRK